MIEKPYTVLKWHDKDNYRCVLCPFDSLHKDVIIRHVLKHAPVPVPTPSKPVVLKDRFGNTLTPSESHSESPMTSKAETSPPAAEPAAADKKKPKKRKKRGG